MLQKCAVQSSFRSVFAARILSFVAACAAGAAAHVSASDAPAGQVKPNGTPTLNTTHPWAQGLLIFGIDNGLGSIVNVCSGYPVTETNYDGNAALTPEAASPYGTTAAARPLTRSFFSAAALAEPAKQQ